jgi:phenylalanyl-tRNA synthetase alpha subunit
LGTLEKQRNTSFYWYVKQKNTFSMALSVSCPHCDGEIEVESINCGIFRHAVFKETNMPINPHASREECETLQNQNLIYGCAGPFRLILQDGVYKAIVCDYI